MKKIWIESVWNSLHCSFSDIADLIVPLLVLDILPFCAWRYIFITSKQTSRPDIRHSIISFPFFWGAFSCAFNHCCLGAHFVLQQVLFSFSWAFFVCVLPQNNRKLHLIGTNLPWSSWSDFSSLSSSSSSWSDSSFFPFCLDRCDVLRLDVAFEVLGRFESTWVSPSSPASWYIQKLCDFSKSSTLKHRELLFQTKISKS